MAQYVQTIKDKYVNISFICQDCGHIIPLRFSNFKATLQSYPTNTALSSYKLIPAKTVEAAAALLGDQVVCPVCASHMVYTDRGLTAISASYIQKGFRSILSNGGFYSDTTIEIPRIMFGYDPYKIILDDKNNQATVARDMLCKYADDMYNALKKALSELDESDKMYIEINRISRVTNDPRVEVQLNTKLPEIKHGGVETRREVCSKFLAALTKLSIQTNALQKPSIEPFLWDGKGNGVPYVTKVFAKGGEDR